MKKGPALLTASAEWGTALGAQRVTGKGGESPLVTAGKGELKQPASNRSDTEPKTWREQMLKQHPAGKELAGEGGDVSGSDYFLPLSQSQAFCPCSPQIFWDKQPVPKASSCYPSLGAQPCSVGAERFIVCVYLVRRLLTSSAFGFYHDCHFKC